MPRLGRKLAEASPLTRMEKAGVEMQACMRLMKWLWRPSLLRATAMKVHSSQSKALAKSILRIKAC
jgi:hypothetical protein